MSTPYITNLASLQEYILRRLGSPVINVELSPQQISDVIDEAMGTFCLIAYNGTTLKIAALPLVVGQNMYTLSYNTSSVVYIFNPNSFGMIADLAGPDSVFQVSDYLAQNFLDQGYFSGGMLLSYTLFQMFAETFDMKFSSKIMFDFNSATKELVLHSIPDNTQTVGMIYYDTVDPTNTEYPNYQYIYDDIYFKKLVIAIAQEQWGRNLLKYSGSPLPAGMTINGEKIFEEGKESKEKIIEELYERYQLPTDFFVG